MVNYYYFQIHIQTFFYLKSFFSHVVMKPNYWHFTNDEAQILIEGNNIKKSIVYNYINLFKLF